MPPLCVRFRQLFFSQALAHLEKNAVEFGHLFRRNLYALCPQSCDQQAAGEPHEEPDQQSVEETKYGDGQQQPNNDGKNKKDNES